MRSRVLAIVSRRVLLHSKFSTVICAPVYSARHGISTRVEIGVDEGLKHDSAILCDELVSLPKVMLTDFVGTLSPTKLRELDTALGIALGIELEPFGVLGAHDHAHPRALRQRR